MFPAEWYKPVRCWSLHTKHLYTSTPLPPQPPPQPCRCLHLHSHTPVQPNAYELPLTCVHSFYTWASLISHTYRLPSPPTITSSLPHLGCLVPRSLRPETHYPSPTLPALLRGWKEWCTPAGHHWSHGSLGRFLVPVLCPRLWPSWCCRNSHCHSPITSASLSSFSLFLLNFYVLQLSSLYTLLHLSLFLYLSISFLWLLSYFSINFLPNYLFLFPMSTSMVRILFFLYLLICLSILKCFPSFP